MFSPSRLLLFIISSLLLNHLLLQFVNFADGLRIDVKRKHFVRLNGVEIMEDSLLDHLEDHERELIFGKTKTKREVKFVHLVRRDDDDNDDDGEEEDMDHLHQRHKRSTEAHRNGIHQATSSINGQKEVSIQIQDNDGQLVDLTLRQTPKLIDDAFIFIRRYANTSQFIEDSHKLAEEYASCFYRNENSALDLCDDEAVRGVYHHNSTDFLIHPLPKRFGNTTHVIFKSNGGQPFDYDALNTDLNFQFEPEKDSFNDNAVVVLPETDQSLRPTRNTNNYIGQQSHRRLAHNSQHEHQQRHRHHSVADNQSRSRSQHDHRQHDRQSNHSSPRRRRRRRRRRHIDSGAQWKIPQVLHIEIAIFVDSDLFKHMVKNFPKNTESHLIRFVLAMINGVQLLYNHPSLGHRINFILKRLEILYTDPKELGRSSDIDTYLNNFCMWQKNLNPMPDSNAVHYDHAVILTGLDLFVVGKNGKVSSQVVGLAPVAGMCTATSSCTINEGKHFESVFVVAHEIGHNLGMRHDTNENSCHPSLYIMSPTLGSGKITWSKCSRTYLNAFLETSQAKCLFDRGQFGRNLDHAAEGILPGERFDADQQCMLKYGRDSIRSRNQIISDICRDLHCQRDRYIWTSHPALEGTECGEMMWCRSGVCIMKATLMESHSTAKQVKADAKTSYDKKNSIDNSKMGHLVHEYNLNKPIEPPTWGEWGEASECDSGCLYGVSKRLREGSTGLKTYSRSCLDYRRRCQGRDRKFESCIAKQCYSITITTIEEFASQVCERAQKFDSELTGVGQQIVGDLEESCKVFCKTKSDGTKSRSWTFPDGTTCRSKIHNFDDTSYCIAGRCEKFSCGNSSGNYYKIDPIFCPHRHVGDESRRWNSIAVSRYPSVDNSYNSSARNFNIARGPTTTKRSKFENEVVMRNFHGQSQNPIKRKSEPYQNWKYNNNHNSLASQSQQQSEWTVKSGCHSSCMERAKGVQVVTSRKTGTNNIQLCSHKIKPCDRVQTETEYAKNICGRYKLKVRGLSGNGTQIAASVNDPDRSCHVACQDEFLKHRYYIVNGKYGHFPLGTKCSGTEDRYCVNGKCLEFGPDNIPLQQAHISLAMYRNKRSISEASVSRTRSAEKFSHLDTISRRKRSYLYYTPVNITETVTQELLDSIIDKLTNNEPRSLIDEAISKDHIEFTNPIHISTDELIN